MFLPIKTAKVFHLLCSSPRNFFSSAPSVRAALHELIMVDLISSRRHDGFPPKFRRPRVSAVRDYPREFGMSMTTVEPRKGRKEIANVRPSACCPVLRKYPPPRIRKGVHVTRDFPVKPNAPAALRNQISDPKGSHSCGTSVADCKQLDDFQICTDAKQDNLSVVRDSKPSDVSDATNARDIHACKESVEDSSLSMVAQDEKCQVDVSITTNFYACTDVKESSLVMVSGDEQCQAASFGLDVYQVVLKDEEREKVIYVDPLASLPMVVWDEQCSNVQTKVHGYQAAFSDEECEEALLEVSNFETSIRNNELKINSDKVKEVINLFQEVYLELLQVRGRKQKGSLPIEAASILLRQQRWINRERRLGPIPGVEVGDYFGWRAELNIIGLHRQHYHGIDYLDLHGKILATSIVDSGRYDNVMESNDEQEFPDTLIYSGEGENPKIWSKKSISDQKLERGNLALKNSAEAKTPIRVIRKFCFKAPRKMAERKYVYDGLYFVDDYRQEIGSSGKLVFKFLLRRFPGQPKVDWTKSVWKKHVCVNDISQGKERIPIRAVNALDGEKPPIFNYVTNVTYPESYHPSVIGGGCDCNDGCSDSEDCPCFIKSGGETYNYEECIMRAKPHVIECGPSCKCFTSCINRVSQRGIRFPLEVFKTKRKGWGVRSRSFIPCGSFICEYAGEIIRDKEGERRVGSDEYLFDIGNNYGDHSLRDANTLGSYLVNECFTIDAAQFGNVGRFINHSCSPNLFAQNVLFDHDDKSMPHIMLFAMEDVPPLKELTYHYNYRIGEVCDANGNIKMKSCHCGSTECTGRMY
ncbi:hypothetical protein DITRI_Ditri07aG0052300 [Diplodiscus trichospermus]